MPEKAKLRMGTGVAATTTSPYRDHGPLSARGPRSRFGPGSGGRPTRPSRPEQLRDDQGELLTQ